MVKKCNTKTRKEKTKMIEPQKEKRNASDYTLSLTYKRYYDDDKNTLGAGIVFNEDITKLDEFDLNRELNHMLYHFREQLYKLQKEEK